MLLIFFLNTAEAADPDKRRAENEKNKELKQVGVDFRQVGTFYQCRDCQEFMGKPNRNFTSHESGKDFTLEESVWEDVYSYKPNSTQIKELMDSRK